MNRREPQFCVNHPARVALEACEVCGKSLCAYCLYYTEDGQRLCAQHAEQARLLGHAIEEPAQYADEFELAQVGGARKSLRALRDESDLYKGNGTDLTAFIGMLTTIFSLGACCGAMYLMPLIGFVLSLVGMLNANKAYDPQRARRMSLAGLLIGGAYIAVIGLCILAFLGPLTLGPTFFQFNPALAPLFYTETPTETPTPTGSPTRTPDPREATWTPGPPDSATPTPVLSGR